MDSPLTGVNYLLSLQRETSRDYIPTFQRKLFHGTLTEVKVNHGLVECIAHSIISISIKSCYINARTRYERPKTSTGSLQPTTYMS